MSKLTLNYAEFYITNVCNLACDGCNRFNNYKFTGFQRWEDYASDYEVWSKKIDIRFIGLLGGEPLLNPTCRDWIIGLRKLWPVSTVKVVTNGFHLNKVDGLYDMIRRDRRIELWVGVHNKQHKKEIYDILNEFMVSPLKTEFNGDNKYLQYATVTDANGVRIKVEYNWWFHQGSLIPGEQGFRLHTSDPIKAHDNCSMKECHHFIKGKLYKCGVVGVLPEFSEQHKMILDGEERELMLGYKPLTVNDDSDTFIEFFNNLTNPIEQCKFCPEKYHGDQIYSSKK